MTVDLTKLYSRVIELSTGTELNILQSESGDVGCVVWDAALALCGYLDHCRATNVIEWTNKTVIELGAGTGAAGLVSSSFGSCSIITDLPELVPLMEKNVEMNKDKLTGDCQACALTWGSSDLPTTVKDVASSRGVDFILVADCVYYQESVEKLVNTIVSLSSRQTTVLCSYEERELGNKEELQSQFFKLIGEHFDMMEIPQSEQHPEYNSPDIHIFKFTLRADSV